MSWACPECNRQFAHANQWHSCEQHSVDEHFANREPKLRELFETFVERIQPFGSFRVEPVQTSIIFKREKAFASVKVMKDCLEVNFSLTEPTDEFPVLRVTQYSKHRYEHAVRFDSPKEIDDQLLGWLKQAYELEAGK